MFVAPGLIDVCRPGLDPGSIFFNQQLKIKVDSGSRPERRDGGFRLKAGTTRHGFQLKSGMTLRFYVNLRVLKYSL
jgi:hypothetical protein